MNVSFFGGAALEAAHQVLDAFLSGGDGFRDAHFVWHVADDGKADLVSLCCGRKVRVVRNDALYFDEVDALAL